MTTMGPPPDDPAPPVTARDEPQQSPPANVGMISPDGRWRWDGTSWQPAGGAPPPPPSAPSAIRSPDGLWVWNGSTWQPTGAPPPPAGSYPGYGPYATPHLTAVPKNPAVSLIISVFLPGVGSMVNGDVGVGVLILVSYLVAWFLVLVVIGLILVPAVWIWGLVHAYQGAKRWNLAHGFLS